MEALQQMDPEAKLACLVVPRLPTGDVWLMDFSVEKTAKGTVRLNFTNDKLWVLPRSASSPTSSTKP